MDEAATKETTLYLTFRIKNELFALNVAQVREVLDLCEITRVPRTPEFMRGVINLRGSVIPVIDLRLKFDMSETKSTIDARIMVIEIDLDESKAVVGVLTESVHDVIEMESGGFDTAPQMGSRWRTEFIKGIGRHEDQFILLLDINRIFSGDVRTIAEAQVSDNSGYQEEDS